MSDTSGNGNGNGSAVRLKDVYDIVDSTRRDLSQQMAGLVERVDKMVIDHERRLTINEAYITGLRQELASATQRLDDHGRNIGRIKDRIRDDEAAEAVIKEQRERRSNNRKYVITAIIAAAGSIAGLLLVVTTVH